MKSISMLRCRVSGGYTGSMLASSAGSAMRFSRNTTFRRLSSSGKTGVRDALANPGKRPNWDVSYDAFSKGVDHGRRTLLKNPSDRTEREQDALVDYFVKSSSGAIGKEKYDALKLKELSEKLKKLEEKYPRLSTAMTLAEDNERLPTHVRIRGNWSEKGDEVTPGTPASLPPLKEGTDRLALAKWLVARENPLTARVTVNRLWQELFGRGLVRTSRRLWRTE